MEKRNRGSLSQSESFVSGSDFKNSLLNQTKIEITNLSINKEEIKRSETYRQNNISELRRNNFMESSI